ncbi:pentatricopeptide repeat protein [Niveomyces insectorum RCEF 264]|uniref:Pentatricopeptide repeat protein n=1 Tax=Niveomyces insectorum RCEF 264 TaxID=1081102 RepID=A0A167PGN6_9HYPO|nr:pentatricopeptide repeat protein [Niveomyces insectorum RCEF 264]
MANDEINVPSLVLILVVSGFLIRHFFFRGPASAGSAAESGAAAATGGARGGVSGRQQQQQQQQQHGPSREQRRAEALDRRTETAVDHIQQIFPYADRRDVWWDLRRNGINVAATTERILAGRLETPPNSFQPPAPPVRTPSGSAAGAANNAAGASSAAAASSSSSSAAGKATPPSLIQRYRLEDRLHSDSAATVGSWDKPADGNPTAPSSSSSSPAPSPAPGTKPKGWSTNRDERQALLKKRRDEMILEARRKMEAKIAAEKAPAGA